MQADPPVAGKKGEGEPRSGIFGAGPGDKLGENDQTEEDQEVQGPDAQDTAHIEGLQLDGAHLVALPEEQFRDEEGAEQEEYGHSQVAQKKDVVKPIMLPRVNRDKVHPMDDEDDHEGNEAKYIEFRAIVAFDGHVGAGRSSSHLAERPEKVSNPFILSNPAFCRVVRLRGLFAKPH